MLAIRLQRTGRKGHANFRVVVQDSHRSPKRGKVVERLGSYDPHTKTVAIEKERAEHFLKHGAHPSDRVAGLLKAEGIKLPDWFEASPKQKKAIRNPEKLRENRPVGAPEPEKTKKEEVPEELAAKETVAEEAVTAEAQADSAATEEVEAKAEDPSAEPETTVAKAEEMPVPPVENQQAGPAEDVKTEDAKSEDAAAEPKT